MNRGAVLFPLLTWILSSACSATAVDPLDTSINWLGACDSDSDCGEQYQCLCNICTLPCNEQTVCVGRPRDAVCAPAAGSCSRAASICQRPTTTGDLERSAVGDSRAGDRDAGTTTIDTLLDTSRRRDGDDNSSTRSDATAGRDETATQFSTADGSTRNDDTRTSADTSTDGFDTRTASSSSASSSVGTSNSASNGTGTGTGTWDVPSFSPYCQVDIVRGVATVDELCGEDEVCCGYCGCEPCAAQPPPDYPVNCQPPAGPPCGVGYCREKGDVCCDGEGGVCASSVEECPDGVAAEPTPACVPMHEQRETNLGNTTWFGNLELVQEYRGQTKNLVLPVALEFTNYSLPARSLVSLGYVAPDWSAYSLQFTADLNLEDLYESQGTSRAYAFRPDEATGAANELRFLDSCYNARRDAVHWQYEVNLALADLVDYSPYAYADPDAPVTTLVAEERFVLDVREERTVLLVEASSMGEVDGELVQFSVSGELTMD